MVKILDEVVTKLVEILYFCQMMNNKKVLILEVKGGRVQNKIVKSHLNLTILIIHHLTKV